MQSPQTICYVTLIKIKHLTQNTCHHITCSPLLSIIAAKLINKIITQSNKLRKHIYLKLNPIRKMCLQHQNNLKLRSYNIQSRNNNFERGF